MSIPVAERYYYFVGERTDTPKPLFRANGEIIDYFTEASEAAIVNGYLFLIEVVRRDNGKVSIGEDLGVYANSYYKKRAFVGWENLRKVAQEFPEIVGIVDQVKAIEFLRNP